ncbi:hypothetical protein QJS10_CPA07g01061 [Acorus calamus]|uniref:Uncharacterized protein n=1 Tax=Acorus calamus TaxID=4465 RepID=A0AAV9EFT3_ACOCL|nr:hypothetical protein QJS10_CPA07g01061 [Acorus calamus]
MHAREESQKEQLKMFGDNDKKGNVNEGENEDLRTLDCLRGRLLAERLASKAAKENAELMKKKLMELERHVHLEIELARRAEKRLQFVLKRLESLKLCDHFSRSSSTSSSSMTASGLQKKSHQNQDLEMEGHRSCDSDGRVVEDQKINDMSISNYTEDDNSTSSSSGSILQFPSPEGSWYSAGTAYSHNDEYQCQNEDSKCGDQPSVKEFGNEALRESSNGENELERERDDLLSEDNMLALVEKPPIINSIQDVLVSLRHAKEQLQSSVNRCVAV